jgi:serine/threonine-protein kinase
MVCAGKSGRDDVKLLDFGLAREAGNDSDGDDDARQVVGTPLYMSPEAVTTPENVDARSDVYAIGALGYFLLTGAPPFTGKNAVEVLGHHVYSAPEPISARRAAIPRRLEDLILRCMAKAPTARPASAAELRAELLALASDPVEVTTEHETLAA